MKKALPYILIVVVLLIGGGIYLQTAKSDQPIFSSSFNFGKGGEEESKEQNTPGEPNLKNYGAAPEFAGINKWLNTENNSPLKMSELKGKVVLVDFWTYSCINCVRTLPYVTKWHDTYKDQGFVVVGVHTPEFAFEKVTGNVENSIKTHNIHYPVAQ